MKVIDNEFLDFILLESLLLGDVPFPRTKNEGIQFILMYLIWTNAIDGCLEVEGKLENQKNIEISKLILRHIDQIENLAKNRIYLPGIALSKKVIEQKLLTQNEIKGKQRTPVVFSIAVLTVFEILSFLKLDNQFLRDFLSNNGLLVNMLRKEFSQQVIDRSICLVPTYRSGEKRWDYSYIETLERSAYSVGLKIVEKKKTERFKRMKSAFMKVLFDNQMMIIEHFKNEFDDEKLEFYSFFAVKMNLVISSGRTNGQISEELNPKVN